MSFLYNNVAVLVVAAVASAMAWLFGGARGDLLTPVVPWLFVLLVEVLVCYPQRHQGESTYEARSRVWYELKRSKIVWIACGFMALLMVPFFNSGLCTSCDFAEIARGASSAPPVPFLPFCVSKLDHLNVVLWFMIALPSAIAVHHCLTRRGKRMVIELIVWNGVALAILGFIQGVADAHGPFWCDLGSRGRTFFFSTFGYPNMAGDYFTTLFGLSVALWRDRCEQLRREELARGEDAGPSGKEATRRDLFLRKHYFLMPAVLFFFAAVNTLSRAAIILVTSTALIYFLHTLIVCLARMHRSRRLLAVVWSMLAFGLIVTLAIVTMPDKVKREVNTLETTGMLDRVTGRSQHHVDVATALWRDHPFFGIGGWGYAHLSFDKMKDLNVPKRNWQRIGGVNVHNDHLQFLAEHGIVGFGALLAIVVLLLCPVFWQWRSMVMALRFKKGKNRPPRPISVFALPAPAFFILTTAVATTIHAFGDCPLRSCAVLDLFFISIAAIPGFMPRQEPRW